MVTPKRGRGARNQAAKGKAAAPAEEVQAAAPEAEPVAEAEPSADDNNGDIEPMEQGDEAAAADAAGDAADGEQNQSNAEAEGETEEKKEEKVESGKLLVENLPPSYLFDYQDKLKELFSKHGEITNVKRGPIIVTELTTTPTLSAIVEFKNKESLDKALTEEGTVVDGCAISVAIESRPETAVLVGVPYEASTDYVRLLFAQCGHVAHIHEFSKTKYKILRVTFHEREGVEKALKLDRELRINGFLVTVSKYRDDDEQKAHNASANKKRQHGSGQRNNNQASAAPAAPAAANNSPNGRNNNYRPRGAPYTARPTNYRGNRGRGGFGGGRGGSFPRGGFAPLNTYMPPQPFMGRPGGFMDGQRPNKRLRQM